MPITGVIRHRKCRFPVHLPVSRRFHDFSIPSEKCGIFVNFPHIKRTLIKKEDTLKIMLVPTRIFFTKGVGIHRDRLASYELALRKAGIERCNLVYVSSIFPPNCKEISTPQGLEALKSGGITYCVMARNETNEPNRLVSAAIGLALPKEAEEYGYLSEHHAFGETKERTGEYAEDLAATMLATTLGIEFDLNAAWSEREQIYKASGKIIKTKHVCQSAEGDKNGLWTTVIAVAVFL
jgi:arginine decarboxylase